MVKITDGKIYLKNGRELVASCPLSDDEARRGTIAFGILSSHNLSGKPGKLKIKFDAMASHDITYVGIIQTARASGLEKFPIPYVLTNCHNSLCAVGGTINEDDHLFGLSAAKKYGGIYVPAHQAVIHSFMRERYAFCGGMILGSDSHTRYGALGTLAIGEGGPELVKQLLGRTYDIDMPGVTAVRLTGRPAPGVGPHDVALALIGAVFKRGFAKNRILEFVGDGIEGLSVEYRNGIDVMTTETACLSSIWTTDGRVRDYYAKHKRADAYRELKPAEYACYDGLVDIDLNSIEPMIALPFHPSNAVTIRELQNNPADVLARFGLKMDKNIRNGKLTADQGVIAGCAGGIYDNLVAAADIMRGKSIGSDGFSLSVYPASQPVMNEIMRTGVAAELADAGVSLRSAFCGPCFGAGDVPANGCLSIRHSTRNFPNREGSKPGENQSAYVALMDARSIAATAINGGVITPATDLDVDYSDADSCSFDDRSYASRVYDGFGRPMPETALRFGPNIADWPRIAPLGDNILMQVCSYITDDVTTTDELIPSGETSSYRSNPMKLASFTLSRKDPGYVDRAKKAVDEPLPDYAEKMIDVPVQRGSVIYCRKPGDGSAREQAASCQRVLGGLANIALEYATKRYRSNLINWGMIPFTVESEPEFGVGDYILVKGIRKAVAGGDGKIAATVIGRGGVKDISLNLPELTDAERDIILSGCLINYYAGGQD